MKEHEILKYLILDISDAFSESVPVRTEGGDQSANPPEAVISWDSTRLENYQGHTPYKGPIRDSSGNAVGKEYHGYFLMDADVLVRHDDELKRDKMLDELHRKFVPVEDEPSIFDDDTSEWSVGVSSPRSNSFVEPDWYEMGVPISFTYLKRVEAEPENLPGTIENIDVYVNDRELHVGANESRTVDRDRTVYYESLHVEGELIINGTVYTSSITTGTDGTIDDTVGDLRIVDQPYDEIDDTTSETLI